MTETSSSGRGGSVVPAPIVRTMDATTVDRAAEVNGLRRMGVRPALAPYVRELWRRRAFIGVLAASKAYARDQNTYLGQLWALLNPVLNAMVYVVIFGFILQVGRAGIENTIGFIVVGVFMFRFFELSVHAGSRSISKNLNLVRSVQFPRAVLPLAGVAAELMTLAPALLVMIAIAHVSGYLPTEGEVPISWRWLLLVPAVLLLWLFSTGCGLIVARLVAETPDLNNLIPFALRILMYASGVIFSVDRYLGDYAWGWIAQYQPVAVYLALARAAVLKEPAYPLDATMWVLGAAWAIVFAIGGFIAFWRGEERYGRD